MTTIKDVAKEAGVSVSIVSKAFNNYTDVNEKTRQRIFEIAEQMGYTPNIVAKNLSSKKQMTIGLISSGVLNNSEKDNNAFNIFKGVYTAVSASQFELSIYLIDSQRQKQKSYAKYCRERNIGGALLQGIRIDDPYYIELIDTNIPCVVLDIIPETTNGLVGSVSIDNVRASKEMAMYLFERNHRDIAIIAGRKNTYVNSERIKGVQEAFKENGLELNLEGIMYADFSEQEAYEMSKKYLETKRPTAFLCFSDLMAFGVMKAVKEVGLKVPEDISITGFDDLVFSSYTDPQLTTIGQDFFEIGKLAAQLLEDLMENNLDHKHVNVEHKLVERGSVKSISSRKE
ncbi:transcriptional regulator, LacI family [Psychrobacillus sp. OK028]|uniref:LacI family DNA-binding transcriptional regulator n=1 Tax=Psychrobacillus sp. OK028 TaxID=1884359 RepID=UPI000887F8B9|nr:LacI family DNA-binding transcriptional regulator [Psychrobacillus sp. OK028]SDN13575.1 transcriptional regulator, LacI family [Psychrobacillus sp. OK028]